MIKKPHWRCHKKPSPIPKSSPYQDSVTEDFADINSQPITKTFAGAITKPYFFYFFFRLKYIRELLVAEVLSFLFVVVLYGNSQELWLSVLYWFCLSKNIVIIVCNMVKPSILLSSFSYEFNYCSDDVVIVLKEYEENNIQTL